jgi:hypothetical protein
MRSWRGVKHASTWVVASRRLLGELCQRAGLYYGLVSGAPRITLPDPIGRRAGAGKIDKDSRAMLDVKGIFDWAKDNGEVKAVDRILVKVMLLLIKNRITLTAATIAKMETRMALPEELVAAIVRAAEEVVGRPVPDFLLAREASNV